MCHLHLEAFAVNPHHAVKGTLHAGETGNCVYKNGCNSAGMQGQN